MSHIPTLQLQPYHYMIGQEIEPVEGGYEIGQESPVITSTVQPVIPFVQQATGIAFPSAPSGPATDPPNQCIEIGTRGGVLRRCFDGAGRLISQSFGPKAPSTAPLPGGVIAPMAEVVPFTIRPPGQQVFVYDATAPAGVAAPPQGAYGPVTSPYEYD